MLSHAFGSVVQMAVSCQGVLNPDTTHPVPCASSPGPNSGASSRCHGPSRLAEVAILHRQTQTHDSCNGDTRLSISVLKVVGSSLPACACFPYALCEQTYHHFTLELSLCTHPIRRPSCDPVVVLALESPEPGVQFGWAVSPGCSAPI
jgi:hypothetical protein